MTIPVTNNFLQDQVEYQVQATRGAVARDTETLAFDFDSAVVDGTTFTYGEFLDLGANGGATKIDNTVSTQATLLGVVPYLNAGVIDSLGYKKGVYDNIMTLRQGTIYLKCADGETILINGDAFLMADPLNADYGLLFATTSAGCIDVSKVVRTVKSTDVNGLILADVRFGEGL